MNELGPRQGRHPAPGLPEGPFPAGPGLRSDVPGPRDPGPVAPRYEPARYEPARYEPARSEPARYEPPLWTTDPAATRVDVPAPVSVGNRPVPGLLDRRPDGTGRLVEPAWWRHATGDHPGHPPTARQGSEESPGRPGRVSGPEDDHPEAQRHPSAPLPPMPTGVWDKLHPRGGAPADGDQTVAWPHLPGTPPRPGRWNGAGDPGPGRWDGAGDPADDDTEAHPVDPSAWEDRTGGLDVIGAHVEENAARRPGRRARREAARRAESGTGTVGEPQASDAAPHDLGDDVLEADGLVHDEHFGEDVPVEAYDPRSGRARRRRRPLAVLFSLLVLAGLVVGIVVGGQQLLTLVDPSARDYTGQGAGTTEIRVRDGDTLSDIARTLVGAGVIASTGPFITAAEADADSVGIQPGVYALRQQMSGQAALDLMLDPAARMLSRITLPEGLTVRRTLARLAEATGKPEAEFQAAAADVVGLGLPAYANGTVEGFLFPATYDVEPDDAPADILRAMVARSVQVLDELQIPVEQRLTVVTKASLVQAEAGSVEDMGKVARVLENRLADGMALQMDSTVNYVNDKGGITTTAQDRANPSPYNTYVHVGLPPGAISNPGEDALRAVLAPTPGEWRFFVVVDPDTGETRFAVTADEHQQNVLLFQQWLRENPGG